MALVKRLNDPVYRHRALQFIADAVIAALAFFLAFQLRFLDVAGGIPDRYWTVLWGSIGFVALGKAVIFTALGLNDKWWRYFYLRDFPQILRAVAVASAVLIVVFTVAQPFPEDVPRSVVVMDFLICLLLVFGGRMVSRFLAERPARSTRRRGQRESLVVGAGSGGQMVVREMHLNPNLGSKAIGFIDDDPRKRGMRLLGLKVMGSTDEIGGILDQTKPDEVIIAIPSAPGVLRGKVVAACREREIPVQTLPTVFELLRGVQLTRQLREVQVEDVLGRDPVVMELDRVGAYLNDRIVLVTGAGGSIGSELSRQIARAPSPPDPARPRRGQPVRDRSRDARRVALHRRRGGARRLQEGDRMLEVMQRFKPEVVFHAAAYKHVPLMETNPLEAVRNNAIATRVTAETAAVAGPSGSCSCRPTRPSIHAP